MLSLSPPWQGKMVVGRETELASPRRDRQRKKQKIRGKNGDNLGTKTNPTRKSK